MSDMSRWQVACALALAALAAGPVAGAPSALPSELVSAAREYRASLANLLPFREEAVTHARATLVTRRQLAEDGLIARREAETAEQTLATAEAALAATHAEIAQAERMEAEAAATAVLASLPPAKPGALLVTPTLPVSALGQTPAHDRLGFDHRNALDVAVHPDSAEGQALMAWLRARGVSFLGFRGAVAGEATGAHVHIGEPSPRRAPQRAG
jgi:hypothetical protein